MSCTYRCSPFDHNVHSFIVFKAYFDGVPRRVRVSSEWIRASECCRKSSRVSMVLWSIAIRVCKRRGDKEEVSEIKDLIW